ncbi:hypothetical protein [Methylocystis hirsuta]|nr:hypothetical protein [Methylocystis hirsuta]
MEASGSTGSSLNQAAGAADDMQKRIAQAAQEADNKLLNAFKNINSPTNDIKIGWYGIVGAMADAVEKSERLQRTLNAMTSWSALFKEIGSAYDKVDRMLGARPVVSLENENRPRLAGPGDIPFPNFNEAKQGFLPRLVNAPVGDTRKLFESTKDRKERRSPEQRAAEKFTDIETDLQGKIALASAKEESAAHDQIALKIKIENEQRKIGVGATQQQKDEVAALVTQLDAAERAQKAATKEAEAWRDGLREVGDIARNVFSSVASDLRSTNKEGTTFKSTLDLIDRKMMDIASRTLSDSLFGSGKDKSDSGLLGGLFKSGIGALGNAFGFGSGGGSSAFSTPLFSGKPFTFGFADGGIMTSGGPLPLHRYAGGGIANSPQLAMFGEGRTPEAYVPLPDGRSIPVAMRGQSSNVTVHNYAAGVDVTPQVTHEGVTLIVQSALQGFSKQVPGIIADSQRRSNR